MPEPIATALATAAAGEVVNQAAQGIGRTISENLGKVAKSVADRAAVALQLGFHEYLATSYNKCRVFKSILSPHAPIDLLSHYVHVSFTCGPKVIEDYDVVRGILSTKRAVITGLAGSGKSMFMKFFTVSHFENPQGAIPLFVELRHLNNVTEPNLLAYVRSACTSKSHNVSAEQFALSLRAGAFILVLDGFDELNHEIRDNLERQILALDKDFPETAVVISSRPDDRFASWTSYYVYKVNALTKSQVVQLIQSLEYDSAVKKRFLKEVSSRLYETHQSFLSSPLLASIMLLTYEEFAEIPQKMHAFYGQAFDTLFQRHDAQKEQYQRKTHTQLTRDAFKDCFSAFCAMSYLEQRFAFDDEALTSTAASAVKYMKQTSEGFPRTVTEAQFVADLFESVCMLQRDGLEAAFVHRSFQEYFAAVFVKTLHGERMKKFLDRYAARFNDSVVAMAVEMSRQAIENEWVLPKIEELESVLNLQRPRENLYRKIDALVPDIFVEVFNNKMFVSSTRIEWNLFGALETLAKIYPKHLPRSVIFRKFPELPISTIRERISAPEFASKRRRAKLIRMFDAGERVTRNTLQHTRRVTSSEAQLKLSSGDNWWLEIIGIADAFEELARGLNAIKKEIQGRDRRREHILDEFF